MAENLSREVPARSWSERLVRSLFGKLVLLLIIFLAVPIVVYGQFQRADTEKNAILLQGVREQGRLAAEALRPLLEQSDPQTDPRSLPKVGQALTRLIGGQARARLLYRPAGVADSEGFYLVAATPPATAAQLEQERNDLLAMGLLEKLSETCEGGLATALRYRNPSGQEEFLSSAVPLHVASGCWVVVTSYRTDELIGAQISRPYWQAPEVQWSLAVYVLMAVLVLWLFAGVWQSLRRFVALAREIRDHGGHGRSFRRLNAVPELDGVASEFDALVDGLSSSAESVRSAAEENAHAFKTPIAVISQSLEPLRRLLPPENERGRRAVELIGRAVVRLDALVTAARRMDEATADLMGVPRRRLELESFLRRMLAGYAERTIGSDLRLSISLHGPARVLASEELLETVLENVLDNAIGFSPPGGEIAVRLERKAGKAVVTVADQGPGVPPADLERIFERYYSTRQGGSEDGQHFGIGLWLARRNVQALGGSMTAVNLRPRGLEMAIAIPLAD